MLILRFFVQFMYAFKKLYYRVETEIEGLKISNLSPRQIVRQSINSSFNTYFLN